ncbi:hypothetical protein DRQ09_09975 [candidate division KSB1 bacterium]|nr:MAG: hypothetical protein DRQ09_09975 [candidate division KSB1 bacterium]
MEEIIKDYLSKLAFGEIQKYQNMVVIPVFSPITNNLQYITLKEAIKKKKLVVKEVSISGSVPTLKVTNKANICVLILDGEELAGAKQNRIVNTSILLKRKSKTTIPVSCTEQGRWSYTSRRFDDSDFIAFQELRKKKTASVSDSLKYRNQFIADQYEVWNEIKMKFAQTKTSSPTGAMKDAFESSKDNLDNFLNAFKCEPEQKGLFVIINGEVAGMDAVSLESAYKVLHPKLVKSYAMDAMMRNEKENNGEPMKKAKDFLDNAAKCEDKKYKSIGNGWDYRLEGKNIVGSALLYKETVVHISLFNFKKSDRIVRFPGRFRCFNNGIIF